MSSPDAGHGIDTDILVSSTKAYIAALNRLASAENKLPPGDAPKKESAQAKEVAHA